MTMCDGTFSELKFDDNGIDLDRFRFRGEGMRRIQTRCPVCQQPVDAIVTRPLEKDVGNVWPIVTRICYHEAP